MADRIKGITVEIGGDVSGLNKALSSTNKQIKTTQSQLRDVERLLKLDPSNTQLLEQKQRLLGEAVSGTKDKLDALKTAEKQVQEQFKRGEVSQDQYEGLQREIVDTEQKLKSLETQARNTGTTLSASLATAGETLTNAGGKITAAGEALMPLSAGAAAMGGASLVMASNFEDAMAKVSTIADTTEVPLDELEQAIMDLSNETGIAATDIADNVYNAISAGQKTGDAVNFVSKSTKLAKAGFTDSASALDILTTTLNAYGLEASEVGMVSDMLIQTQNLGKTTVGELASAMGKVIPTAKQNNVELEQLSAAYAIMTSNGIATAETTTYLNSMLNELGKGGTNVDKILREQTGKSFAQLSEDGMSLSDVLSMLKDHAAQSGQSFSDLWGSAEAAKAGAVLLGDSADNFNGVMQQMIDSTGSTDTAFDKLSTTSSKVKISVNELKNTVMDLGSEGLEALQPVIESVTAAIYDLVQWFSGLSGGQKRAILTILALVAAIGPALIAIGKIATGVGSLMTLFSTLGGTVLPALSAAFSFLAANPIVLVVAAIVAVIAIIKHLWDTSEEFRTAVTEIWSGIQEVFQGFDTWLSGIFATDWTEQFGVLGGVLNGFFHTASGVWESIKQVFGGIVDFISGVFTGDWDKAWGGVKKIFSGVFGALEAIAKAPLNAVIGLLNGAIGAINRLIQGFNSIGFDMPKWLGGGSWHPNIPTIPSIAYLAKGGTLLSGSAVVGEAGPELLSLVNGKARVQPLNAGERAAAVGGSAEVRHTFAPLRVEGVNDRGQFVAAADYAVEELLTDILRRQARV